MLFFNPKFIFASLLILLSRALNFGVPVKSIEVTVDKALKYMASGNHPIVRRTINGQVKLVLGHAPLCKETLDELVNLGIVQCDYDIKFKSGNYKLEIFTLTILGICMAIENNYLYIDIPTSVQEIPLPIIDISKLLGINNLDEGTINIFREMVSSNIAILGIKDSSEKSRFKIGERTLSHVEMMKLSYSSGLIRKPFQTTHDGTTISVFTLSPIGFTIALISEDMDVANTMAGLNTHSSNAVPAT